MIIVIDYNMGNLKSIVNMLKKSGSGAMISRSKDDILNAERLILPGVGSFDHGMENLQILGYIPLLQRKVLEEKTPILGICLGCQLFTRRSEEGLRPGLGWIDAETVRFDFGENPSSLKIPHVGWNIAAAERPGPLFPETHLEQRFYFVHSYHLKCSDPADILTTTEYGYPFTSAVSRNNIVGVQFHPEKSHRYGLEFLTRWVKWTPDRSE